MRPATPREAILRMPRFLLGRFLVAASFAGIWRSGGVTACRKVRGLGWGFGIPRLGEIFGEFRESWRRYGASDKLTVSHSHVRI